MKLALAVSSNTLAGVADTPVLLEAATELGVETRLVDWRADGWDWAEAVLLHAPWDYTDDVGAFTGWLQQRATLTPMFNPAARAVTTTHKSYLVDLIAAGVPAPPTHLLRSGERVDLDTLRGVLGAAPLIAKPAVGAGGRRLVRMAGVDELRSCPLISSTGAALEDLLVQTFVSSVLTGGERSLVLINGRASHVVSKTPAAGQFRVQASYGGTERRVEVDATAANMALLVQPWTKDLAYARIDYVIDDDGEPLLMELELTEPDLFLRHHPSAARELLDHVVAAASRT